MHDHGDHIAMARQPKKEDEKLVGWKQIAGFLGVGVSTAQRWAKSDMPLRRESRKVVASPEELNAWLGREVAEPVHIATAASDLTSELKRGLAFVQKQRKDREA
jgi:hypothetical protein